MKKIFLYSLPLLFIGGSISHFLYDLLGNNFVIGLVTPVNESIYEHTKLSIIPLTIFYIFLYKNKKENKIILCFLISLITTTILIPMLYYFYTSAFSYSSLIIDILIFFISITLGQLLSLHIYKYLNKLVNIRLIVGLMITCFLLNIIFTLTPPRLPIFNDPVSNTYGIFKDWYFT